MMDWLSQVFDLFNHTLAAALDFPPLRLFMGVLLFLTITALLMYIFHQGRKGRL